MKIESMKIENFKGIKSLELNFSDITNIIGDNATGKTSIYDAWLWLLFDKNSSDKKDFSIRPMPKNNDLPTSVSATISIDKKYTLKKVYSEKIVKSEIIGNYTKYFINEIPLKKGEYDHRVTLPVEAIEDDISKILSNPIFFNEKKSWQERRNVLIGLCDTEMPDAELAMKLGFTDLKELEECDAADYKAKLKTYLSDIKKELIGIPPAILELENFSPFVSGTLEEELEGVLEAQFVGSNLEEELREVMKARAAMTPTKNEEALEVQDEINNLKVLKSKEDVAKIDQISLLNSRKQFPAPLVPDSSEQLKERLDILRADWKELFSQKWEGSSECPTCKRELPPADIKAAQDQFNLNKANTLGKINDEGKMLTKEYEKMKAKIKEAQIALKKVEEGNLEIDKKIKEVGKIKSAYDAKITRLQERLSSISREDKEKATMDGSEGLIEELDKKIEGIKENIAKERDYERAQARIKELSQKERHLHIGLEEIETTIRSVDRFVHAKMSKIEKEINNKFEFIKFQLFEEQINGGISSTCIATINGVPYPDLNGAAKIKAGLDIIRTLQIFYSIRLPIFIDNRESITEIPDMSGTQIINLIVDENTKTLKIKEATK